jgi:hypothetical protein
MIYIVNYNGLDISVYAIKTYIDRGEYYLKFNTDNTMSIEFCDSSETSTLLNKNGRYNHKIIISNREIHTDDVLYNDHIVIDPKLGEELIRNYTIKKILSQ